MQMQATARLCSHALIAQHRKYMCPMAPDSRRNAGLITHTDCVNSSSAY
jgi:hypothetical protein